MQYFFAGIHGVNNVFLDKKAGVVYEKGENREVMTVSKLKETFSKAYKDLPENKFVLLNSQNHDRACIMKEFRPEIYLGSEGAEAILTFIFTAKGVPMIYNGNEVADTRQKNMFWNRFYPGCNTVEWENALFDCGKKRIELVKQLTKLRRENSAIYDGDFEWIEIDNDDVLAFTRKSNERKITVFINVTCKPQTVLLPNKSNDILLSTNASIDKDTVKLDSYGWLIIE